MGLECEYLRDRDAILHHLPYILSCIFLLPFFTYLIFFVYIYPFFFLFLYLPRVVRRGFFLQRPRFRPFQDLFYPTGLTISETRQFSIIVHTITRRKEKQRKLSQESKQVRLAGR